MMRISKSILLAAIAVVVLATGCAGPEQKLGRGLRNATEFTRLGEIRRSMEQTAIWETPERSYTTGFIEGFNKSVKRTAVGVYEIVTFPIPGYDPVGVDDSVVYPENYRPNLLSDTTYAADSDLGFSGGDMLPILGSRFRVFDY
jgi:putative exosortase-associated protein (TIGR04073 family)